MIFLLQGCSVIGGIFKAGIWVGVLAVILLVIVVFAIANKVKK
jgi:TRAP-type C4-dicarboxylate transport system permease large subunit